MAAALNGLADVSAAEGDLAGARRLYEDCLRQFQQIGDGWGAAAVLRDLGDLSCRAGDHSGAAGFYKNALAIFHKVGNRRGMARVLDYLAACATYNASPDCAIKLAGAAAAMREKLGISLTPTEHDELDRTIRSACQDLPTPEQTKAWAEGRSMTTDQLLTFVLST
jgi:tetratricopeptide (TPR) repeat protein